MHTNKWILEGNQLSLDSQLRNLTNLQSKWAQIPRKQKTKNKVGLFLFDARREPCLPFSCVYKRLSLTQSLVLFQTQRSENKVSGVYSHCVFRLISRSRSKWSSEAGASTVLSSRPAVRTNTCHPGAREAAAGGSSQAQGSVGYGARPCLKETGEGRQKRKERMKEQSKGGREGEREGKKNSIYRHQ